jgi:hypothetical protein
VFQLTMLLRLTLLAAVVSAFSAAPARAQTPTLTLDKPCYVAAQENQREYAVLSGQGFTPFKYIDLYIDDVPTQAPGEPPQADVNGNLSGSVQAPIIDENERTFIVRATEHENSLIFATKQAKVTRLSVEQTPASAATSQRVRFRGRGFTDLTQPVYMHYVFAGKSRKTIKIGLPTGDCGHFSVRRKQFPFKKSPQVGVWTIQFDQERTFNPLATKRVALTIKVKKTIRPQPAQGR